MNKKILIIIISVLIVVVLILAGFLLLRTQPSEQSQTQPKKETVLEPAGEKLPDPINKNSQTSLFLFPNPIPFSTPLESATQSATAYVEIDTGENEVSKVQFELSFDPKSVTLSNVVPNGANEQFFKDPVVLLQLIDNTNGTVLYSVENSSGFVKGQGIVATLTFSKNPEASSSSSIIRFLGKTATAAKDMTSSSLKQSLGATFLLQNKTSIDNP